MKLADLNARFKWIADGRLDSWRILKTPTGALRGDCDDYAVTALYCVAGSMWKFWWLVISCQAIFWLTRAENGEKHVVLWVRKHGYIDNICPAFQPETPHSKIIPFILPLPMVKMAFGWIATWWASVYK